jgi:hypothetical protein
MPKSPYWNKTSKPSETIYDIILLFIPRASLNSRSIYFGVETKYIFR